MVQARWWSKNKHGATIRADIHMFNQVRLFITSVNANANIFELAMVIDSSEAFTSKALESALGLPK